MAVAKDLPCWLASAAINMLLIIMLGLWTYQHREVARPLVLSAEVNDLDHQGDAQWLAPLAEQAEFEPPLSLAAVGDSTSPVDVEPEMAALPIDQAGDRFGSW